MSSEESVCKPSWGLAGTEILPAGGVTVYGCLIFQNILPCILMPQPQRLPIFSSPGYGNVLFSVVPGKEPMASSMLGMDSGDSITVGGCSSLGESGESGQAESMNLNWPEL